MNAIVLNRKLDRNEKPVLLAVASMFWNGKGATFEEAQEIKASDLLLRTSMSPATLFRTLASLEHRGYIIRRQNKTAKGDRNTASTYVITDLMFSDYVEQYPNVVPIRGMG